MLAGVVPSNSVVAFDLTTLEVVGSLMAPGFGRERVHGLALDTSRSCLYLANQSERRVYHGTLVWAAP